MVGLLSYRAEPDLACMYALLSSQPAAIMAGWHLVMSCRFGDSILPRARCSLLGEFVRSDCEKLLMIDDDVSWQPEGLIRILGHREDIVGGVYPKKGDDLSYPALLRKDRPPIREDGLVEVDGLPGGFMCIGRNAAWKLVERYSQNVYWDQASGLDCWVLWDFGWKPEGWHGEDYRFCDRWKAMGGKLWADTGIPLSHTGKKTWTGDFGAWLRREYAKPLGEVVRLS